MKIKEGALVFSFSTTDGSQAIKYDNTKFYRKQFINIASGTKAVDIIFFDKTNYTTWLIEVKDYRHRQIRFIKPSELGAVIAEKVRDTLSGLVAARYNANDQNEREFSDKALKTDRLKVILFIEQPKYQPINLSDLHLKLRQRLRAVDAHPRIMNSNAQPFPWLQVSSLPFQSQ